MDKEDGLYVVEHTAGLNGCKGFIAGFVIEDGLLIKCAPILRKKIDYWKGRAVRIPRRDENSKIKYLDV
jgi:hypothetical protein